MKKNEFPKLPKIELICDIDDLRPVFSYINVTKENVYASDAHILVRLKTNELFPKLFAESIPDEGIFIHRNAFILMHRNKYQLSEDKKYIQILCKDGAVINYDCKPDMKYPSCDQLIPDIKNAKPIHEIGLNANLLNKLSQALIIGNGILHLYFYEVSKSILCIPNRKDDYNFNAVGIIMPALIN